MSEAVAATAADGPTSKTGFGLLGLCDDELDAAVLLVALVGLLAAGQLFFAGTAGVDRLGYAALFEGVDHRVGAALGQLFVVGVVASRVGVSNDVHRGKLGVVGQRGRDVVEDVRGVVKNLVAVAGEVNLLVDRQVVAFDVHVARIQLQQNDDMRKISAGAAIVVVPTLIAGIYGMNFDDMPELHWSLGYPFALLLMAGASGALWWFFKRAGWL